MDKHRIAAFALLSVLLLSFLPSIWYANYKSVDWYLLVDSKRYIDLVIEDYADLLSFTLIYWIAFRYTKQKIIRNAFWFLLILSGLDIIHLALWDMEIKLWLPKFITASGIWLLSRSSMV